MSRKELKINRHIFENKISEIKNRHSEEMATIRRRTKRLFKRYNYKLDKLENLIDLWENRNEYQKKLISEIEVEFHKGSIYRQQIMKSAAIADRGLNDIDYIKTKLRKQENTIRKVK
ncbi:MAG: hypothetical protein ABIJ97_03090 [Bacteroidota bacterium]